MDEPLARLNDLRRYARLTASALEAAEPWTFSPEAESAEAVQVERGLVLPQALLSPQTPPQAEAVGRLVELAGSPRLADAAVLDRGGHRRSVYRPLLVYAWLQAFRLAYETLPRAEFGRWEHAARAWCDALESRLGEAAPFDPSAARGAEVAEQCWTALALHVAGKVFVRDAWTDLAADAFGRLTRHQQPGGAFLATTPSDNPETAWYHELAVLHAAASYAVQAEDRSAASAVAKNSLFHLNETQPDHATAQPWGLFAFAWNPAARPLADGLLHAVAAQAAGGVSGGVSAILLADALYCLRLFG